MIGVEHRTGRLGLVLCAMSMCTAPSQHEAEPADAVPAAPSEVEAPRAPTIVDYGPCLSLRAEGPAPMPPRCTFAPGRPFRLWVEREALAELEVFVDGQPVATYELERVDDGSRGVGVALGETATTLEVRLGTGHERWVLPVQAQTCAECHHGGGDAARAAAASLIGRSYDPASRVDWTRELPPVLERLEAEGLVEEQLGAIDVGQHSLSREHRFDEAAAVLALAEPLHDRSPRLRAVLANGRGQLDWRRGRLDDALTSLRAASQHAVRTDEIDIGMIALPMYAELLAELGYLHAALRWSDEGLSLVRAHGDACEVASTLRTTAWVHVLLRLHGWSYRDPRPLLAEALAIFERDRECHGPEHEGGALASLALLHLLDGDPGQALAILRGVELSRMTAGERVLASDVALRARLALGDPPVSIDRALEQLRHAVVDAGTTDAQWHLALREGQVLGSRGDLDAAIEAYRRAEEHLDRLAQLAAFGVGLGAMGVLHRESSERLVDALRERGSVGEALCVARTAEARRIQAASFPSSLPASERERIELRVAELREAQADLDALLEQARKAPVHGLERARARVKEQRRSVDLAIDEILRANGRHAQPPDCDALHEPAEGELLLGLFPRGDGWLVFAHDEHETTAHAVVLQELDLEPARLAPLLLRPVATQLARAKRIRVHAVGQAERIDVDRLPWNGKPLIAHAPVAWGVDVTAPAVDGARLRDRDEVPRALLLADPTLSLPEAAAEVQEAAEQLGHLGWIVEVLPPEQARPYVVQERLDTATLVHYAGHATHDELLAPGWWPPYAGGTPSWPAGLRLADDTWLGAHEILAQSGRVPRTVILSGCRTGAIETSTSGTSLAVAFLVAGAEEVIATTTVTKDAEARATMRGVYEGIGPASDLDWTLVDAHAREEVRRIEAGEASGGLRVWVR